MGGRGVNWRSAATHINGTKTAIINAVVQSTESMPGLNSNFDLVNRDYLKETFSLLAPSFFFPAEKPLCLRIVFLDFLLSSQKLEGEAAQFVLPCPWLGPNIEQVIETLTFVEAEWGEKISQRNVTQ